MIEQKLLDWSTGLPHSGSRFYPLNMNIRFLKNSCVLVFVGFVSSCPLGQADSKNPEIAVSLPNLAWAATAFMGRSAQDEGKKLGINIVIIDAQGDTSKEASDLKGVITRGVDGIVIEPVDEQASAAAIDDVVTEKIPVATFCS